MGILQSAFWKTLLQEKKVLLIVILITLVIVFGIYSWYQLKRSWNWNVGGYQSRAQELVCEMAHNGAIAKGPNFKKVCE